VQIFFVLSGFVIAYSCRAETTRTFIIKRFLRLTPAMWICATICGVLSVWLGFNTVSKAILLTLKSAVFYPKGPWIGGQFWTLPVEISFYAVLAIMLAVDRKESLERLAIVLALLSGAYWITQVSVSEIQRRTSRSSCCSSTAVISHWACFFCVLLDTSAPRALLLADFSARQGCLAPTHPGCVVSSSSVRAFAE